MSAQIDNAIAAIESLRGGTVPAASRPAGTAANNGANGSAGEVDGPGALLGMSIADAAKKLLPGSQANHT